MKKELCLMSTLLILCCSYSGVNADEKTAAPAKPAVAPVKAAPAPVPTSKPEVFVNKPESKPAAEDVNADPLAFLPEVVAKIGDDTISKADIQGEFKPVISMMKENGQLGTIPAEMWKSEVKKRVSDMVSTKLLLKLAEDDGYKPEPAKAEEEFKKITAQLPPEQLAETLAKQGMTAETIKGRIAIGLAIQKWIEEKFAANIKISDEEAEKYYNENPERFKRPETVKASHILIKIDEIDPEKAKGMTDEQKNKASGELKQQALKKAQDILAQLKNGGDFAKLATENSACPSKEKGGDLGTFDKGKMAPEFEKSAFSLKPGETSDVVETEFGYHIIKTTEKNDAGVMPFKDVKGFLVDGLKKQKTSQAIQEKIETEKKNRKVEIFV
jgi:peptidyl-prolyl cis-trans isomerase C